MPGRFAFWPCLLMLFSVPLFAAEPRNVAILIHQGVELLDFAGPGEVFASAGNGAFRVFTVGPTKEAILSQGFVTITPDYSVDDSPEPAIIVIPGGRTSVLFNDPKVMHWIKSKSDKAELIMSVCNGAITLAKTGLLDGLRATSHWGSIPALRQFSKVTVVPEARFVDNGRIMSTQGVAAGIDGALHVVERLLGSEAAWSDAHYMMYPWEPALVSEQEKSELRPWIFQDWKTVEAIYGPRASAAPQSRVAAERLGIAQEELGEHEAAITTLEHAVMAGSVNPDVFDDLAQALSELHRYGEAARMLETEIPLRSASARPWVQLHVAEAWSLSGNKDAALAALHVATENGVVSKLVILDDSKLSALREDQRFAALVKQAP